MKNFGYNINVDKNSNCIVGHSEVDCSHIRPGSLINIHNDNHFYTIASTEPLSFISEFISEGRNLIINGNYENYFLLDDILTLSYKEYELLTIKEVTNRGANYQVGDTLSLNGGVLSINILDNIFENSLHMRMYGSGLASMTYVAEGRFDLFFNLETNPWDILPGALIITEAGGMVTDINGNEIDINSNSVLATNGKIHSKMLKLLENK